MRRKRSGAPQQVSGGGLTVWFGEDVTDWLMAL
jgi:hypothetical protein